MPTGSYTLIRPARVSTASHPRPPFGGPNILCKNVWIIYVNHHGPDNTIKRRPRTRSSWRLNARSRLFYANTPGSGPSVSSCPVLAYRCPRLHARRRFPRFDLSSEVRPTFFLHVIPPVTAFPTRAPHSLCNLRSGAENTTSGCLSYDYVARRRDCRKTQETFLVRVHTKSQLVVFEPQGISVALPGGSPYAFVRFLSPDTSFESTLFGPTPVPPPPLAAI